MGRVVTIAVATVLTLYSATAAAVVAITPGTPTNNLVSTAVLNGIYTSLPTPPVQPLAVQPFILTLMIPQAVSIQYAATSGFTFDGVSGSYLNNGQTESFSNGFLIVQDYNAATQVTLYISHLLTTTDRISLVTSFAGHLYNFSQNNTSATANAGIYVATGNADYSTTGDPPFTGTLTVTPDASSVPEPSVWALMIAGFGGIGLALRRVRKKTHAPLAS